MPDPIEVFGRMRDFLLELGRDLLKQIGPLTRRLHRLHEKYKSARANSTHAALWSRALVVIAGALFTTGAIVLVNNYLKVSGMIDQKLSGEVFQRPAQVYAGPWIIYPGQRIRPQQLITYLTKAGYSQRSEGPADVGTYSHSERGLEVVPGQGSYHGSAGRSVRIEFDRRSITRIVALPKREKLSSFELEPKFITNIFDKTREKRRLISYESIPGVLRDAVLAIEDRRFFTHRGFDLIALISAALGGFERGASTITQQLVRSPSFWLTPERRMIRKLKEIYMAAILETRLTKEEIFTLYANDVYLGQRGSFSINGFAEAARAYFNRDIQGLSVSEAAVLAGMIQSPNRYNPTRHPEWAAERRNAVLRAMLETGSLSPEQFQQAVKAPLQVAPIKVDVSDAPYFVDLIKNRLLENYSEKDLFSQGYRIYTTLDLDLQRLAYQAVRDGTRRVDEILAKRRPGKVQVKKGRAPPETGIDPQDQVQACLVALDPHTGEILALVGGRDYSQSQLNRVTTARRQPGSIFKPFVFAAGLNSAITGSLPVITPSTMVIDSPSTFLSGHETYEPNNYGGKYFGLVTLRRSLTKSLNVATVKFAEEAGLSNVVALARRAGLKGQLMPTPALALGAYEVTPLEMAAAYTIFANGGKATDPVLVRAIKDTAGEFIEKTRPNGREVLDSRVAYLMTRLMEGVINDGTGARVRRMGFAHPAAGKTGTSHDGWFAGYTTGLLCIVWVGFDDNRELNLEGASSALPIWTEFMKKAVALQPWLAASPFTPPDHGLTTATIDPDTGLLASSEACETVISESYISGTEPRQVCSLADHHWISRLRGASLGKGSVQPFELGSSQSDTHIVTDLLRKAGYRIVLNDGRIVETQSKPVKMDGHLVFRDVGNMTYSLPVSQVDVKATRAENQRVHQSTQVRSAVDPPGTELEETLSGSGGKYGAAVAQARGYPVIHDHVFGGCKGNLSISSESVTFLPVEGSNHGFSFKLNEIIDTELGGKLKIKFRHRTYRFKARFARNRQDNSALLQAIERQLAMKAGRKLDSW